MIETKLMILKGLKVSVLAEAAGTDRSNLSNILSGKRVAAKNTALRLSKCANELTGWSVFEPSDFNPALTALDNLSMNIHVRVYSLLWHDSKIMKVEQLLNEHQHDLTLLKALNNLVYEGQSQNWGGYIIDLYDTEQPERW